MLNKLEIGELFNEGVTKYKEGIVFDIDDNGCNLIIRFNSPSNNEVKAIKQGSLKCGYYTEKEAIFMLFKFDGIEWMDAPYSVELSKKLTKIHEINDGQGLALNIYLIDADTGILKAMRLIGLPTAFSRKIKVIVERQRSMPFENYYQTINAVYMKYPTKKLVDYADVICNV
ncbi:hypothetical protein [Clostridium beijerinckii]|uniref:hypothetical protein n=1 Tax=Clostridium beijerinckii TaxID=1520 RepID=UPI001360D575|nr:hypothetical protein [Clostridium beijerinckii]MZK49025.1 hypothetical protein [Clostridium beijerinckii]MZK57400.1 hypothetical protein [Clostridium beijerinckii]MZK67611.1 hypothetical protein [Clostridium beijerinckii]MZK72696.1 hypothetical protein [Clostridium beijerinckii]MZK82292.1 hypothetical protein [Clostridium beijerinckii]